MTAILRQILDRRPPTLAVVVLAITGCMSVCQAQSPLMQGGVSTTPSQMYFNAIEDLYQGEYRDAQRDFVFELRGSIKIGVNTRWIDSICYHAMLGETYYHMGLPDRALEQYNLACAMYLQYPNWMLQVQFNSPRADTSRIRRPIPWGASRRQFTLGKFNRQMNIMQGELFGEQRAIQQGGVIRTAQFWQVDVVEVLRATALSIRRRNELLGPLAPEDTTTKALVGALSRGAAPPNHWSSAWIDLLLGLAYLGEGNERQALPRLARAERVAGRFDHPLTCISLVERGRLAMEAGKTAEANDLLSEASYSAFYYEDIGVIDEAFRLMTLNRLASTFSGVNPMLEPAAAWCRRERYEHIFSQLNLAYAEELMRLDNWSGAAGAVKVAQSRMRDAAAGRLGNHSQYLAARVEFAQGSKRAGQRFERALQRQAEISIRNFQLALANQLFDSRQLRSRRAVNVYLSLLADPTPADWIFRPLETLARLKSPQGESFDRWIAASLDQKDPKQALEIADRAKRRHFHAMLPWSGRKLALRAVLESSPQELTQQGQTRRNALLMRVPQYERALQKGQELRSQLEAGWTAGMDDKAWQELVRLWRNWQDTLDARESSLTSLALDRVPVVMGFPPLVEYKAVQSKLKPGQAVLIYHDSPAGLLGFLMTSEGSTHWNCGPSTRVASLLSKFLRDLGNYDATYDLNAEQLRSEDWHQSGQELYEVLLSGSALEPSALEELIVVPDGLLWYVPYTALPINSQGEVTPLIAAAKVRIAPTLGLALGSEQPWRRVQRTAIIGHEISPGDDDEAQIANLAPLRSSMEMAVELPEPLPVSAQAFASLLDGVIVLEEQELELSDPLAWSPFPTNHAAARSSLGDWSRLPRLSPQRMIFPGVRTIAERGGKAPSRRKRSGGQPGSELFLASCELMASGTQTILISRWKVGGKSTIELMREFVQELPYTNAPEAWQRCVEVVRELPLEPNQEPRVKAGKGDGQLTADHPIFWSGYLLIDTGASSPAEVEAKAAVVETSPELEEAK